MYGKLCKYEFRSIMRTLMPIYLAVIVVSIINALSMGFNDLFHITSSDNMIVSSSMGNTVIELMQGTVLFAYFSVLVALFVLTFVVIIQRFYKGLLCDEGYLMFTLPVKPWQLIAAKGTAAFVMSVVSVIAAGLSILILMCGSIGPIEFFRMFDPRFWKEFFFVMQRVFPHIGLVFLYGVELLALTIISGMASLFHVYLSMAVGHLMNKHRVLMSVVAYIAISMAMSFFSGIAMLILDNTAVLENLNYLSSPHLVMQVLMLSLLLWELAQLALFFFGTERILSKKLNLE